MTTPHHSKPAREAVALVRRIRETERYYEPGDKHRSERFALSDDEAARLLSDSSASAASGGLEASEPGAGMAEMAEIARIVGEWRNGPMLSPEALRQIAAALAAPAATGGAEFWVAYTPAGAFYSHISSAAGIEAARKLGLTLRPVGASVGVKEAVFKAIDDFAAEQDALRLRTRMPHVGEMASIKGTAATQIKDRIRAALEVRSDG